MTLITSRPLLALIWHSHSLCLSSSCLGACGLSGSATAQPNPTSCRPEASPEQSVQAVVMLTDAASCRLSHSLCRPVPSASTAQYLQPLCFPPPPASLRCSCAHGWPGAMGCSVGAAPHHLLSAFVTCSSLFKPPRQTVFLKFSVCMGKKEWCLDRD